LDLVRDSVRDVGPGGRPVVRFEGTDRLSHLIGIFPLRGDDGVNLGSVAVVRPLDELRRDLKATAASAVVSILLLIAGISAVEWLLVLIVVRRPMSSFVLAMRSVRAGDLSASVPERRADEVGAATAEFNSMVRELREARSQLIEAAESREALEA